LGIFFLDIVVLADIYSFESLPNLVIPFSPDFLSWPRDLMADMQSFEPLPNLIVPFSQDFLS
jgi:hypothetical protein